MSRKDWFRSILREIVSRSRESVTQSGAAEALRKRLEVLTQNTLRLDEPAISRALAELPAITDLVVRVRDKSIRVDATYQRDNGLSESKLSVRLVPVHARFVARGAKELGFRVEPPELAEDRRCWDLVGALGGLLAVRLWGTLSSEDSQPVAFVDRQQDLLTCDLRTVGFVRELCRRPATAVALELFRVGSVWVEDGAWVFGMRFLRSR